MRDPSIIVKMLVDTLLADWSHAMNMYDHFIESWLNNRNRKTHPAGPYRLAAAEAQESIQKWATGDNPVIWYIPDGITAEQAKTLAHLVATRNTTALYLALLYVAKHGKPPAAAEEPPARAALKTES